MTVLSRIGGALRSFGGFWYDFVIGDDWVAAAGVAVLLGAAYGLLRLGVRAFWAGPVVVVATAALLVVRAERRERRARGSRSGDDAQA